MKTVEERISQLTDLGAIYDEKNRAFIKDNVRIDVDVVQYGSDLLFEKQLKKLTN